MRRDRRDWRFYCAAVANCSAKWSAWASSSTSPTSATRASGRRSIIPRPGLGEPSNCRALVPHDRQFRDEQIRALVQRGAVIGAAFDAWMLVPGWVRGSITPEGAGVMLESVVDTSITSARSRATPACGDRVRSRRRVRTRAMPLRRRHHCGSPQAPGAARGARLQPDDVDLDRPRELPAVSAECVAVVKGAHRVPRGSTGFHQVLFHQVLFRQVLFRRSLSELFRSARFCSARFRRGSVPRVPLGSARFGPVPSRQFPVSQLVTGNWLLVTGYSEHISQRDPDSGGCRRRFPTDSGSSWS